MTKRARPIALDLKMRGLEHLTTFQDALKALVDMSGLGPKLLGRAAGVHWMTIHN